MQVSASAVLSASALPFPNEIIFHILHLLDPCDVIRLRLVSKQFNSVTRDARLWKTLYTHSRLLLPPGPFPWQSAQSLERMLIHSARVSRTWTLQPMNVVSRVRGPRIPVQPCPISTPFDFLYGRLFIWCEGEQLLAQDLETGVGRLLWESTAPISSLSACSMTLPDSERVFVALRHIDAPIHQRTPIKLLGFPLQDDVRLMLGPVIFEMDLPTCANFPLSAKPPLLYFDGGTDRLFGYTCERTVIDTRTWAIYQFPAFSSCIEEGTRWEPVPWTPKFTLLSGTHIMVFHPLWDSELDPPMTLIQAFIAPPSTQLSDTDTGKLRLTHEVLVGYSHGPVCCLRGAIVDRATGEVNIRFLIFNRHHEQTQLLSVDLTIPPEDATSTEVLPMVVETQELFVLSGRLRTLFFDNSDDGYGRGIFTLSPPPFSDPQVDPIPVSLYKFSVDASGDRCTTVVSEPRELAAQDVFRYAEYYIFNGVRGRVCLDQEVNKSCFDLVVVDLH